MGYVGRNAKCLGRRSLQEWQTRAPGLGTRSRAFYLIQTSKGLPSVHSSSFLLGVVSSQQQVVGVGLAGTVRGEASNRKSKTAVGLCISNCPRALPRPLGL